MFWGRAGVVACAAALVLLLWKLSQRKNGTSPVFYVAALMLMASSTMMYEDFAVRPETFAVALFCASYWLWKKAVTASEAVPRLLGAGVLAGLAAFASPRALFLFPLFTSPFFGKPSVRAGYASKLLVLGSVAGFLGYALLMGHALSDYATFVLWFSAKLQKVGAPFPLRGYYWDRSPFVLVPLLGSFALLFLFLRQAPAEQRSRQIFWLFTPLIPLLAGALTSYPHLFPQNLMMGLVYAAIALVESGKDFSWPERETRPALAAFMIWFLCTTLVDLRKLRFHEQDIVSGMSRKQQLLDELSPQDKVLLPYDRHLIAIADASYYAGYLESYSRRQADFVAWAKKYYPLPPFDLLGDLKRENPVYICPKSLGAVISSDEREEFVTLRKKNYRFLYSEDKRWEFSFLAKRTVAVALGNSTP